jgi:hypothetical protein
MNLIIIFVIGLIVTAITMAAVLLVGISEAKDPEHNRPPEQDGSLKQQPMAE